MILTFIVEEFLINLTVIVEEVLITLTFMVEEVLTFNLVIPDIIEIDNLDILELELLITLTFVLETFFINPKDLLGDRQNSLLTSGWGGRCMVSYLNSKHVVCFVDKIMEAHLEVSTHRISFPGIPYGYEICMPTMAWYRKHKP